MNDEQNTDRVKPQGTSQSPEALFAILDEYCTALQSGGDISPEQWAVNHPGGADVLQPLRALAALDDARRMVEEDSRVPLPTPIDPPAEGDTPAGQPLRPGMTLGQYRIEARLGGGGMGDVYKVEQMYLKRPAALKVISTRLVGYHGFADRFRREVRAMGQLKHPNIVHAESAGEANGLLYLVMEYVPGSNLEQHVQSHGRVDAFWACQYMRQAALGLEYAHKQGYVHRDIKPSNLLLTPDGIVKIADFGLVRTSQGPLEATGSLTNPGVPLGTLDFMSPEQARDAAQADERSDLFSLGCTFFYLLTGRPPARVSSQAERLVVGSLPSVLEVRRDVPPAVAAVVDKLLVNPREDCYPNARAVIDALEQVLSELPTPPEPLSSFSSPSAEARSEALGLGSDRPLSSEIAQSAPTPPPKSRATDVIHARVEPFSVVPTVPAARPLSPRKRAWWIVAVGVAVLLAPLVWLCGPTVIRFATNKGELIVEVNDPTIEVSVKGNGLLIECSKDRRWVLTAGDGEIEVREPGSADALVVKEFKLRRGGKEVIRVTLDELSKGRKSKDQPPQAQGSVRNREKPFVLVRKGADRREEFEQLAAALAVTGSGDTVEIEVHGNGPFQLPKIEFPGTRLVLRAATGYRPLFVPMGKLEAVPLDFGKASVVLEGCDFRFVGATCSGPSWNIRNCRWEAPPFWSPITYTGQKLQVSDSLFTLGHKPLVETIESRPDVELEFTNNVLRGTLAGLILARGGERIRLRHNTILTINGFLGLNSNVTQPVVVDVEGNLFSSPERPLFSPMDSRLLEKFLKWQGKENLYAGAAILDGEEAGKITPRDLDAWGRFWGQKEKGSRHVPDVQFQWQTVAVSDVATGQTFLQQALDEMRRRNDLPKLGPEWKYVGPGDAYVAALAMEGRAVPRDKLKPEAPAGGPFVIVRGGKADAGHPTLQAAFDAVASGDVVEIRSDGLLKAKAADGVLADARLSKKEGTKTVTLRAAPGYRPILVGRINFHGGEVTVEGIEFHEGGLSLVHSVPKVTKFVRIANCSFQYSKWMSGHYPGPLDAGFLFESAEDRPAEMVNCFHPGPVYADLVAGKLLVRNCVFGGLDLTTPGVGRRRVELDQCAVWAPGTGFPNQGVGGRALTNVDLSEINAHDTLFEAGFCLLAARKLPLWNGSGNLYRLNGYHFACGTAQGLPWLPSLDPWRANTKSDEKRSAEGDALDLDPLQWKLLPGSPGKGQGPGGNDYGADFSHMRPPSPPRVGSDSPLTRPIPPPADAGLFDQVKNKAGIELVSIPSGWFYMGSDDKDAGKDEKPRHKVTISKPFFLGKTKVTVGQFKRFVEATGYQTESEKAGESRTWKEPGFLNHTVQPAAAFHQTDEHPVVYVSWNDANAFCKWLADETGATVRLPREAEWEYCCRAGTTTRFYFGDTDADLGNFAWYDKNSKYRTNAPCAQKKPNDFGLYDMHGLAWEWCADGQRIYKDEDISDPEGMTTVDDPRRVLRGGSFYNPPQFCRAATRNRHMPSIRLDLIGFRVLVSR